MQVSACPCPDRIEQTANSYALIVDPSQYPAGTPLHSSQSFECSSIWICNQSTQTLSAFVTYGASVGTAAGIELAPGAKEFLTLIDEMEKLIAIPAKRFRPYNWRVNASGVMSLAVMVFP